MNIFNYCDNCVHARYRIDDEKVVTVVPYVCTEESINKLSSVKSTQLPEAWPYGEFFVSLDLTIIAKCKLMGVRILHA